MVSESLLSGSIDNTGAHSMIKLSKASKMPCRSWSLQALVTCPASKDANGELVAACAGCYATTGNYNFPNVKAPREHNKDDWKRSQWVDDMVNELDSDRYFRWFDSGDLYDIRLARKVLEVMKRTPWVRHWLPTRMHKFDKFVPVLEEMQTLPNVVVRLSSDGVNGETIEGITTSTIVPTSEQAPKNATVCEAYERDGKCGQCRACWNKDVSLVAYVAHGKKMERNLIKMRMVA
jgi:hypothetical protein